MRNILSRQNHSAPRRQAGTALFVALISLVIMTLGAFALVRAIDTNTLIAGNVGFKQAALISSDAGIESAITWIQGNAAALSADSANDGYYSTEQEGLNFFGTDVDWDGGGAGIVNAKKLAADSLNNQVSYIIHRLCRNPGLYNDVDQTCVTYQSGATAPTSSHSGPVYGSGPLDQGPSSQVYYRITARVTGPRNSVTYVQAVVVI